MSSILLNTPFASVPQAPAPASDAPPSLSVMPVTATADPAFAGNTGQFGDAQTGGQSQADTAAFLKQSAARFERTPDATGKSVVEAQGAAIPETLPGANLPEVELPDILPTAPWFQKD